MRRRIRDPRADFKQTRSQRGRSELATIGGPPVELADVSQNELGIFTIGLERLVSRSTVNPSNGQGRAYAKISFGTDGYSSEILVDIGYGNVFNLPAESVRILGVLESLQFGDDGKEEYLGAFVQEGPTVGSLPPTLTLPHFDLLQGAHLDIAPPPFAIAARLTMENPDPQEIDLFWSVDAQTISTRLIRSSDGSPVLAPRPNGADRLRITNARALSATNMISITFILGL